MLCRIHCLKGLHIAKYAKQFKQPIALAGSCKVKRSQPDSTSTQRDLVNFPRPTRLERTPPFVFGFVPKSWFDFFYPKTGVTGGYTLLFSVGVYMFSKEIIVYSPELITALCFINMCVMIQRYVPEISELVDKLQEEEFAAVDSAQENAKKNIRDNMESLKKDAWMAEGVIAMLPEVKRENVYLQMEAAYRVYFKDVHSAVLNILNYQVQKSDIERLFTMKHMTNWLINSVNASITPDIKKVALEKAISDLKALTR